MPPLEPLSRDEAGFVLRGLPCADLAPRLRETLELLIVGHTERQIAQELKISRHTVHVYVKTLYVYFEVNSRSELSAGVVARLVRLLMSDP